MVTHVQTQTTIGASGTSAAVTVSSTAGNTLVVVADAYSGTNAAFHVTGITDGHNTWTFSAASSNQNPPVGQSWDGSFEGLILIGAVVAAAAVTSVTVNFSASLTYIDLAVYEFSGVPAGSSVVAAAASSTLVTAASVTTPAVTVPSGGASVAVAAQTNDGNAGSNTSVGSGWTMDGGTDHFAAWRLSPSAGPLSATFSSTGSQFWPSSAILVIGTTSVIHAGGAGLSGSGTLGAAPLVVQPAAAALSGSGTIVPAATATTIASADLIGEGFVTAGATVFVPGQGSADLSGTGTLGVTRTVAYRQAVPLSGAGTLAAQETGIVQQAADLSGSGTLGVSAAAALKFTAGLFGAGFLSIPQVAGGLVNGVGGVATPMALPGSSQVAVAPPGSTNWQWLGTLGQVTALTYSFVCPGGADKLSMTIMCPASYRTQLFNPGWQVKVTRGGHQVWYGKLDEPQPSPQGWTLTAVGAGNLGQNFLAEYDPGQWGANPDESVNHAIGRGLPWSNIPGIGSPPGIWLGQEIDSGAQTVTALLNLTTSRGGLTWYVSSQPGGLYGGNNLSVFPLPTVPNRLLVCTTPVARTLGGDINTILIRYQSTADNTTASPPVPASYNVVSAINAQSVAAHGTLETYIDIADAGVMTAAQAQAVGNAALLLYQRASFAGPFQASYGQLLNMGGQAIDPGTDQASNMVQMILTDFAYGGEISPGPIRWIIGSYSWDDFRQIATITPMQVLDQSLTGMLSAWNTMNTPITVAST